VVTVAAKRTIWMWLRDLFLYCVIGVLVAGGAILLGDYRAKTMQSPDGSIKWFGFAIMTALVFGNAIRYSKQFWGSSRFWPALLLFSILHLVLGFLVVSRLTKVGMIQFAVVTPIEYFALVAYLGLFTKSER
jgi:hypothetical protein